MSNFVSNLISLLVLLPPVIVAGRRALVNKAWEQEKSEAGKVIDAGAVNPQRSLHSLLGEFYRILPVTTPITTMLIPNRITPAIHIRMATIPAPMIAAPIPITQSMRRTISSASLSVFSSFDQRPLQNCASIHWG